MAPKADGEQHAIVIGGSIAGMVAARVLTASFDRVTLIERDALPAGPQDRAGTPQARHAHVLLVRGRRLLERFFPGFGAALLAAGGIEMDAMAESLSLTGAGWIPRMRSPYQTFVASRPLLDWVVRQQLATLPTLTMIERTEVVGLVRSPGDGGISGVRVRSREDDHREWELPAALVVDASGRTSRAPQWLAALGYPAPHETVINSFIGYASRVYAPPADWQADWKSLFLMGSPPTSNRGGVLFSIEGGRWQVTLAGAAREYPPTDDAGFLAFARTLRSPLLYEALRQATPLTPVTGYQKTENRLRAYDRLPRQPEGFVVLGDAVCAFNPVYGQGMTAAALAAALLETQLREHPDPGAAGWAARFQQRLAKQNAPIWLMATGEDFRYHATEGGQRGRLTKLSHWYFDQFGRQIPRNVAAATTFVEVMHLLRPPTALFHPRFASSVLWHLIRRPTASALTTQPAWIAS
ncbi:MAG TPA: FAD-dependent monooxygenase [Herpetosiphonaceae bacterium]